MPEQDWDEYLSTRTTNAYTDIELIRPYLHGSLLEIGCGYGDFANWCAKECGCRVSGVDPSAAAIQQAQTQYPDGDFKVGVAERLPFADESFDVTVSLEVLEHVKDADKFFTEASRVLKPGGFCVVQTPNYPVKRIYDFIYLALGRRKDFKDDPTHINPCTFGSVRRLAEKHGFKIEKLVGRNILGEQGIEFLKKIKRSCLAPIFSQKMILIAKKITSNQP